MKAYTDYPKPGMSGRQVLREIVLISYDGDKYIVTSEGEHFKAGYAYRNRRRVTFKPSTLMRRLPPTRY